MITITPRAADEIKRIMAQENESDLALRVGVQAGCCSDFSYFLALDKDPGPEDQVLESNGVKVYLDSQSAPHLAGMEIDFTDGLHGPGFTFKNPNAASTCGCGHSFSV
ncbi:MAG: iron-sulfur cluster assembly accessory protein [candidate division KSB1 bacterium]|nr:iron-sulfur cluster assembly accessory protein [candidate division KSB1 bacterium]MDZ7304987.1 iron-sulfur cluster assembly accessory protein [candidate division KSB1 bacterium]MDZ7314030.1 iron-sulfur cluster assembly accessory protein [candidate division KSB1 bacterium]